MGCHTLCLAGMHLWCWESIAVATHAYHIVVKPAMVPDTHMMVMICITMPGLLAHSCAGVLALALGGGMFECVYQLCCRYLMIHQPEMMSWATRYFS